MPQLTKAEIAANVEAFSVNIPDGKITPHINKAIELDFSNIFPASLIAALKALSLSDVAKPQLVAFYNSYFVKVWSHAAFIRFLVWHGTNATQFGLTTVTDESTFNVSDETRAGLIKLAESDFHVYTTLTTNALKLVGFTFDGTKYETESEKVTLTKSKSFGIRASKA